MFFQNTIPAFPTVDSGRQMDSDCLKKKIPKRFPALPYLLRRCVILYKSLIFRYFCEGVSPSPNSTHGVEFPHQIKVFSQPPVESDCRSHSDSRNHPESESPKAYDLQGLGAIPTVGIFWKKFHSVEFQVFSFCF